MRTLAIWSACCFVLLSACAPEKDVATRIASAKEQMARKDCARAVIELKNVLRLDSQNNEARLLLSQCYLDSGFPKEALEQLESDPDNGAKDVVSLRVQARLALGQFEPALQDLDASAVQISDPQRSLYRAQALQGLYRYDESDEALQAAIAAGDESAWPRALLIENIAARGELAKASEQAEQLTDEFPQSAHAWLIRGNIAARSDEQSAAENFWLKATEQPAQLTPQQQVALNFSLAEARLAANDVPGASQYADRLLQIPAGRVLGEFIQGRTLMAQRKYTDAIGKFRDVLGSSPDFKPASVLLAAALVAGGHAAEAEVQLKEMLSANPNDLELRKLLARARLRQGRPADAMTAIEPALAHQSTDSDLNVLASIAPLQLANLATDDEDWNRAAAWLEASRARDPSQFEARIALAHLYFTRGRVNDADTVMSEAVKIAGDSAQRWQSVGSVYVNAGRLKPALECFQKAVEKKDADAKTWFILARTQLAMNDANHARASIQKALELEPNSVAANGLQAVLDATVGNLRDALARLQKIDMSGSRPETRPTWEGEIYVAARRYQDAAAAYERALTAGAGREVALKAAQVRHQGGLKPEYLPLEKWRAAHPDDIGVAMLLAQGYAESGENSKAIAEYESILRAQPKNVGALNNLAWLYHQSRDQKALATAQQAYALAGESPLVADTLGWILLEAGRVAEALPILKSAAEAAPQHADIQFHYAAALARSGDPGRAAEITRGVLAAHGAFESRADAERLLSQLTHR